MGAYHLHCRPVSRPPKCHRATTLRGGAAGGFAVLYDGQPGTKYPISKTNHRHHHLGGWPGGSLGGVLLRVARPADGTRPLQAGCVQLPGRRQHPALRGR